MESTERVERTGIAVVARLADRPEYIRDESHLATMCHTLARGVPQFAEVLEQYGVPPLWVREHGFESIVRVILEQHVSLSSARGRLLVLREQVGQITPAAVAAAGVERLRSLGITQQKAGYLLAAAEAVLDGWMDLDAFASLSDGEVAESLLAVRGIGPWTVAVYLNLVLRRIDVWPPGDVALVRSYGEVFEMVDERELRTRAEAWKPYRSIAARLLWHAYLARRGRSDPPL